MTQSEYDHKRYLEKQEEIKARTRKWAKNNPERKHETDRIYQSTHRRSEASKAASKKWRLANKERTRKTTLLWRKNNPEKWAAQQARDLAGTWKLYRERQNIVLNHYGLKCNCCGSEDKRFLTIDHIGNGRGNPLPRKERKLGSMLYKQIIEAGFPKDYQVLCMNCNWAKGVYGKCFHQKDKEDLEIG